MKSLSRKIPELREKLFNGSKKILIISHRNPDGDAIGSSLGLLHVLESLGHEVNVLVPNRFPAFLNWMSGIDKVTVFNFQEDKAKRLLNTCEILFALDFNDLSRVREFEEHLKDKDAYKILIDHHPNPGAFADITYSETKVSSTAELLFNFLTELGIEDKINLPSATAIYAGILTDTGCFSFNSSRPETFQIVSRLLEIGINKDEIYDKIYDNFSYDRMRLMGYCLDQKMEYLPEFKTAFISLSQEEMKKYRFKIGDSEGFVNLPLSINDVIFSVLITEHKDIVKLSFRSKGKVAINELASKYFNGGGHMNAAGGESHETLDDTIKKFKSILPEYKDALLQG